MRNNLKHIGFLLSCMILMMLDVNGQNPSYKQGISFKTLFLDYQSQNGGTIEAFKDYHHGFEIGYQRKIANKVNLNIPLKIGVVGDYNTSIGKTDKCLHKAVGGLDAQLQYQFYNSTNKIVPYLFTGIGGVAEKEGKFNLQTPFGVGVNFRAANNAYINLQSEYRYSFETNRNNLQHGLGFVYLWGGSGEETSKEEKDVKAEKMDRDNDGVEDKLDLCPDIAGLEKLNGCPDSDKDGIADFQDDCPNEAGSRNLNGCPDSDGDGVADKNDDCPKLVGTITNKGCPENTMVKDADKDGIADDMDKCPNVAGTKDNGGCPSSDKDSDGVEDKLDRCPDVAGLVNLAGCPDKDADGIADPDDKCPTKAGPKVYGGCPDTDGDGLDDSIDKCPNTKGTVASNGCPDISVEDRRTLDVAMRSVQFETGKATLKAESFTILKQIGDILKRYPDYNLSISGHTDNTGSAVANQDLSEKRAKACYDYLITQKVDPSRLSHAGYGESRPISDNTSENGRTLNRRVEFTLNPR
jgi:OmpA-OmpF porin, OOP family